MTDLQQQGERLQELINALALKQNSFAKKIGVTRGYISILASGQKPMSQLVLNKIVDCYPLVNITWLLSGKGEMFLGRASEELSPPVPGLLTGVMEDKVRYEALPRGGVLESALARLSALEYRMAEMEAERDRLRAEFDRRMKEIEEDVRVLKEMVGDKEDET